MLPRQFLTKLQHLTTLFKQNIWSCYIPYNLQISIDWGREREEEPSSVRAARQKRQLFIIFCLVEDREQLKVLPLCASGEKGFDKYSYL